MKRRWQPSDKQREGDSFHRGFFLHSTTGGTFWCKGGKREREARRERGREREGDKQCTHSRLRPALSLPPASHNSIVFLLQRKTQLQLNLDVERVTTVSKKSCSVMEWEESWSFIYLFGFLINSDSNFSSSLQNEIDRKVDENWSTKFYENAETSRPVQERFQKNSWFFKMRRWFFFKRQKLKRHFDWKKKKNFLTEKKVSKLEPSSRWFRCKVFTARRTRARKSWSPRSGARRKTVRKVQFRARTRACWLAPLGPTPRWLCLK